MSNTYLTRTVTSAGNRKTWTFSCWVKRCTTSDNAAGYDSIFSTNISNEGTNIAFGNGSFTADGDYFEVTHAAASGGGTTDWSVRTNPLLRDPSSWYHLVVAFDTTQSTTADRVKLYVNGSEVDKTVTTGPALNTDYEINNTQQHTIGRWQRDANSYFDGYLAHFHFIDGTAYDASAFGLTDSTTGIWVPKTAPSVTYGTNGFFLKMENSGAMGTDSSGNSNTWSVGGGNLIQVTDTPSNVFCTLNPLAKAGIAGAPYDGNLTHTGVGSGYEQTVLGTIMIPAGRGKWYWESKMTGASTSGIGVVATDVVDGTDYTGTYTFSSTPTAPWNYNYGWGVIGGTGNKKHDGAQSSYSTGDLNQVRQCAMDCENGKIYFGVNNVWGDSGDPAAGTNPAYTDTDLSTKNIIPWSAVSDTDGRNRHMNFGNPNAGFNETTNESDGNGFGKFKYAPPTGYYALCTKNLASYG